MMVKLTMGKNYIIFLCLLMLGCSPSEPPLQSNNLNNQAGDNHSNNPPNNPKVKSDLNNVANFSPLAEDFSLAKLGLNKYGLTRIIDHLKFSNLANDRTMTLSSFATALRMAYDWKTDSKETKSYLKGGKEDTIGKLLEILTLKYNRHEARNALIEIIQNEDLLMETIRYFTSEPILDAQKLKDFHHAADLLVKEKDVSGIKELLDDIYVNFYHFFGKHYHLKSVWEEVKENGKTILQPKESGFDKAIFRVNVDNTIIPVDYEPLLNDLVNIEIEKNEKGKGNFKVKKTLKRAVIRELIVDLLTSFVTQYYEIEEDL